MKEIIPLFLKGAAMGAANVIPGVSGGTVAFVTGIYERLIGAIKSIDVDAIKLLLGLNFREFARKIDFFFLLWIGLGVVASLVTLAWLLEKLFDSHPQYVWSLFFGLILASIFFVGKKVNKWGPGPIGTCVVGIAIAVGVALLTPAQQNENFLYLVLCGVVAMASMIIPGLSGSFVLLLMGNYKLVAIDSINQLRELNTEAFQTLFPVGIGAIVGLISLSHLLSWIFKRFHDLTVALLTGFVAGSLLIIWPWKKTEIETFQDGDEVKEVVAGYEWFLPEISTQTLFACALIVVGFVLVWLMEKYGAVEE